MPDPHDQDPMPSEKAVASDAAASPQNFADPSQDGAAETPPKAVKPRFEGPFKQRVAARPRLFGGLFGNGVPSGSVPSGSVASGSVASGSVASGRGGSGSDETGAEPRRPPWLTPWKIYGIGMLIGLGLAGFYATKLMVTREMVLRGQEEPPAPTPVPKPSVSAFCVAIESGGTSAPAELAPFCSEGRPPSCKDRDLLQLTYATNGASPAFAFAAVMHADLRVEIVAEAVPVRAPATEAPFGQWAVRAARARSPVAVVTLFSREPIRAMDVAPFFDAWRQGVRMLTRPPELPTNLLAKGAELIAFQLCVGK